MRNYYYIVTALIIGLMPQQILAAEYTKLSADLDGDNRTETIVLSAPDASLEDEEYRNFSIRIGTSTYTGTYYAIGGDLPKLTAITLDKNLASKQLLVRLQEPMSCEYHVLAYSSSQLVSLLKFKTDGGCEVQFKGDGILEVASWEGFWFRKEIYRLNPKGTLLTHQPQEFYPVGINATANKDVILEKAQCEKTIVKQGSKLRIEKFDLALSRYLISTSFGVCGWLETGKVNKYIGGLSWAG